jgi:Tfp pilus assembly protein PilV
MIRSQTQRGASLIISMIFLVLITFVVINAFNLSNTNLKSVRNEQSRTESIAAANLALDQLIATPGALVQGVAPAAQTVALNGSTGGSTSYTVQFGVPTCVRAVQATIAAPSEVELGSGVSGSDTWDVDIELVATVAEASVGTLVEISQGMRVRMTQNTRVTLCGPVI